MKRLANYFGVSTDYILGNEKKIPVFSDDETHLIYTYRSLTSMDKKFVQDMMRRLDLGRVDINK